MQTQSHPLPKLFYHQVPGGYELDLSYTVSTSVFGIEYTHPGSNSPWFVLTKDGTLTIRHGYQWDGATGAIDTDDFMVASLVHDVICSLTDRGIIPFEHRFEGDRTLVNLAKLAGMPKWRRAYVFSVVRGWSTFAFIRFKLKQAIFGKKYDN